MSEERTELGFSVDAVASLDESLRGKYDTQRLERDKPELVRLIAWLLSIPGMTYQAIAKQSGLAWESVAAIAATRQESIREFKLRQSKLVSLVLDAAQPGLLKRAADGKLTAFEFKLLVDAFQQLSGEGHLVRVEDVRPVNDPARQALDALLAKSPERTAGMVLATGEKSQCGQVVDVASGGVQANTEPEANEHEVDS